MQIDQFTLSPDVLALALIAVFIGALMILAPIFGVLTKRIAFVPSGFGLSFNRDKSHTEVSAGPFFAIIALGAVLVAAPIAGYYYNFSQRELANQIGVLEGEIDDLEDTIKNLKPKWYTFSGTVAISPEPPAGPMSGAMVRPSYPGEPVGGDGQFSVKIWLDPGGIFPSLTITHPLGIDKTIQPNELIPRRDSTKWLEYTASDGRDTNIIVIDRDPTIQP